MTVARDKRPAKAKPVRGCGAFAVALGVSRQHLYAVLRQKRHSKSLWNRYGALKSAGNTTPKTTDS